MLLFHNCQNVIKFDKLKTAQTIYAMTVAAGYPKWNMSISYIRDNTMQQLNKQRRHIDSSTDILSFPAHSRIKTPGKLVVKKHTIKDLGSIFISTPYITAYYVDIWKHLNILYAHGISHLLGFDHEKDEDYALMAPFEKMILDNFESHLNEYDPIEQGLFDSWNWTNELDI